MKNNFYNHRRRGLSSIVGALLFVVLMVATFAVLGVALDSQTDIVDTSRQVADTGLKQQQEDFVITNVYQLPGEKLEIYAKNKGQNPTEIFTLIMTNSSNIESGYPTRTYEIPSDTSFLPPNKENSTNIVETLDIKMKNASPSETDVYKFKVISSLGKIVSFNLVCDEAGLCGQSLGGTGGSGDLVVQLFLDGPNGVNTKTSTVVMFVSNTGDAPLKDIWPDTSCPTLGTFPLITHAPPTDNLGDFTCTSLTPSADPSCGDGSGVCLGAGQTMIFKWDGIVSGDVGDSFNFCNSVSGKQLDDSPVSSNIDCDGLDVIDPNDCGGCDAGGEGGESVIILDDLLIRPSIFVTLPSPFGSTGGGGADNDNLGIVGVQVANPTNSTFSISKVTITAFAPGANNNVLIFDSAGNETHIAPLASDVTDWNLADENVMVWRDFSDPIVLPPYSADSFLIKIKPEPNGGKDLESVIVQASVFSTIGSFGKAGYQTTMYSPAGNDWSPIANVFLTTQVGSVNPSHILGHKLNLLNGTSSEFTVSFADMDDDNTTYIKNGAKMTINIPREWTFDSIDEVKSLKFVFNATEPKIIEHGDGSTQIIATVSENLGDTAAEEVASLTFWATTPEKKTDRMYIMYLLADGLTESDDSVGPQQEVILHVIGNSTGP